MNERETEAGKTPRFEAAFCAPGKRLYIGIALVAAENLAIDCPFYLAVPLALAAIGVNLKRALLRKM